MVEYPCVYCGGTNTWLVGLGFMWNTYHCNDCDRGFTYVDRLDFPEKDLERKVQLAEYAVYDAQEEVKIAQENLAKAEHKLWKARQEWSKQQ